MPDLNKPRSANRQKIFPPKPGVLGLTMKNRELSYITNSEDEEVDRIEKLKID